jgi:carboxymethylenebutenolidase
VLARRRRSGKHVAKKVKKAEKVKKMDLGAIFDAHIRHEFVDHDVAATMKTMAAEPYVHNVPTLTGGDGRAGVVDFYTHHFVGRMPSDTRIERISRTVGRDQVVDELIIYFTHDCPIDYMLPGIPPTGRKVAVPHVVVMKFKGDKVAHEHIYFPNFPFRSMLERKEDLSERPLNTLRFRKTAIHELDLRSVS